jgi:hypothetical protein
MKFAPNLLSSIVILAQAGIQNWKALKALDSRLHGNDSQEYGAMERFLFL